MSSSKQKRVCRFNLLIVLAAFLPGSISGQQWTTGSGGAIYYNGGNVGVGTTAPTAYLHLKGANVPWRGQLTIEATDYAQISFYGGPATQTNLKSRIFYDIAGNQMWFSNDTGAPFVFSGGNVGIGTAAPQYRLSVNGVIGAKEVVVTSTGWSDYVFRPGYRLRPLREVASYIEVNHHLPEIPSEAEVEKNGISMGEMQSKLLAKIEELTLHMIQQEKENEQLRKRVDRLEKGAQ
jgi:hypothetical protein